MDQHAEILKNRIEFCRKLLSQGVSAPDADRLTRAIMELQLELEAHRQRFPSDLIGEGSLSTSCPKSRQ